MTKHFKISIVIMTLFMSTKVFGQMWATPNSEWYYSRNWLTGNGYLKINYTGTATVNSTACQKLDWLTWQYSNLGNSTGSATGTYYTYESDSVVFLFTSSAIWDTLYNYKAKPGDSWLIPRNLVNNCPRYKVTVADTGHKLIQNVNLKWLKLGSNNYGDTIYERIGSLYIFSIFFTDYCGWVDYNVGGPLRCFSDHQIANFKKYSNNCDYFYNPVGIPEIEKSKSISVKPNPTKDYLEIKFETSDFKNIQLYNSSGQLILTKDINAPTLVLDLEKYNNGLYFIIFSSKTGDKSIKKFIKN